jgi:cysteine desulfurase
MKQYIYADNAATTQLDPQAFEAMIPWLRDEYGNASQPYSFSRKPKKAIAEARAVIAECINAEPEEIYFTSGGTESDNWVVKGSAFSDPDHRAMITSQIEHHAVLHSCAAIERIGYPVAYLPADEDGRILPETLDRYISDRTRLVSVMTANNEIGTIQDIARLADIAHAHGAMFHTDAVQAVGHIPIDVKALDVDMLSASAHKFNGPRGIGFLYIRKGIEVHPFMDGGGQENKNRAGTENTAAIVGMSIALMNNIKNMMHTSDSIRSLENLLITKLLEAGLVFRRNGANTLPGLISLSFQNSSGEMLLHRMDLKGICISTGSACDGSNDEISHVLQAIHLPDEYAKGTVRISLGKQNTESDIIKIAESLKQILTPK